MKEDKILPQETLLASDIRARFRWSESTLRRRYAVAGFPKPRFFGQNRIWYLEEVDAWADAHVFGHSRNVTLDAPRECANKITWRDIA